MVIAELPAGRGRVLAHVASQRAGRDDGSLRTTAEYMTLFDLLLRYVSPAPLAKLELLDGAGRPTAVARAAGDYIAASRGKPEFSGAAGRFATAWPQPANRLTSSVAC